MTSPSITFDALQALLRGLSPVGAGRPDGPTPPVVVVDLDERTSDGPLVEAHAGLPVVIVGVTDAVPPEGHPAAATCDVVLARGDAALDAIVATVAAQPIAATALALVLRGSGDRTTDDGLLIESAVYSALQAGPEFAAWRAGRPRRERESSPEPVVLQRDGARLDITLTRPHVRNALDAAMQDGLTEAFGLVALDSTITEVHLRGAGPAFCSGGDLDEFGSFPDPATAHLIRLERSPARAIHAVRDRVTAHLHGACVGSGIELPAFATTVLADPSTVISLPEVSLGLIPGAGGTVSLPRRIGRHRTARLALTGEQIDAATACEWGLVDAMVDAIEQPA